MEEKVIDNTYQETQEMIKRERYIKPIREFYDGNLIKVITGIRRCRKSVILQQILEEIRERSDNTIFLDFEDTAVLNAIPDEMALLNYIDSHRKELLCYVFLDEVQRVDGWAGACRTLRIRNCSVFISGSNSKLLSREFTKELSGRYVPFRIRPFVYRELAEYGEELGKEVSLADYIVWGGFPKRIEYSGESGQRIFACISAFIGSSAQQTLREKQRAVMIITILSIRFINGSSESI